MELLVHWQRYTDRNDFHFLISLEDPDRLMVDMQIGHRIVTAIFRKNCDFDFIVLMDQMLTEFYPEFDGEAEEGAY